MNDNVILLTYDTIEGYRTYGWFNDIKSLNECFDTTGTIEINLSELGK